MKKLILILLAVFITTSMFLHWQASAQVPQKISYQAVIRNTGNVLVTNQPVGIRISILQGSTTGAEVYKEIYNPNPETNANGLVTIEIGSGIPMTEQFSAIDWSDGPYFLKIETDPTGGTNYTITGTSQLLSVPYALYAKTAETISGGITETDPVYTSSQAANITATDITNLSNLSGINTGDQNLSALATKTALGDSTAQLRSEIPDVDEFLSSETDPIFETSTASGITETDITNWNNKKELQFLSYMNDTLYLSMGNYVVLPYIKAVQEGIIIGNIETCNKHMEGAIRYNNTKKAIEYCNGIIWIEISSVTPCSPAPSIADAGNDTIDILSTSIQLNANEPTNGNGNWSILSGEGGSFDDIGNPNTIFHGVSGNEYTLRWTISNDCGMNWDDVNVGFSILPYVEFNGRLYVSPVVNGYRPWGAYDMTIGSTSTTDGQANTDLIVTTLGPGYYAAYLCDTLTAYGFDDWYLPAINELEEIWKHRFELHDTGYGGTSYWSSTEGAPKNAWDIRFYDGAIFNYFKNDSGIGCICVRRNY